MSNYSMLVMLVYNTFKHKITFKVKLCKALLTLNKAQKAQDIKIA